MRRRDDGYISGRVLQALAVIRRHTGADLARVLVKQPLRASSHIGTMALEQILSRARSIMKDEPLADEPVAAAAQLSYKDGESSRTENRVGKKNTCSRSDG